MRSSHVDIYNHDEDAPTYDRDVLRSEDPIREGYNEVLGETTRFSTLSWGIKVQAMGIAGV